MQASILRGLCRSQSFDDLLLMKHGGSVIYHGHLGKRSHRLIEYFKAVPGMPDLQEGLNPATWMLQVSTPGMESTLGVDFAEIYRSSALFRWICRQCRHPLPHIAREQCCPLHAHCMCRGLHLTGPR